MTQAVIPAACPSCGALFVSRLIAISGNVENLTLSNNRETCPFCGALANTADGVFNVADDILSVISAPSTTRLMLAAFGAAVRKAHTEKTAPEQLAEEVEKIDPSFGKIIRKVGKNERLYFTSLIIFLAAIKSCIVEVKLDANLLIEQITNSSPAAVLSQTQDKKPM